MTPSVIPFEPIEENFRKLKQYLLDTFASSTFNRSAPFSQRSRVLAHIHIKPDTASVARHTLIPVPIHLQDDFNRGLKEDVKRGIIVTVPADIPTTWCHTAVIIEKKNGKHRHTVDFRHLNAQCLRETHVLLG